jgi:catalase
METYRNLFRDGMATHGSAKAVLVDSIATVSKLHRALFRRAIIAAGPTSNKSLVKAKFVCKRTKRTTPKGTEMPLPNDARVVALANDILQQFDKIFGLHPGFRAAHAKGLTVRFSNSTGIPLLPDNSPDANPRGLAIRFNLADHVHTDMVTHSTDGFPSRDGKEFLEFLLAVAASGADVPSPKPIETFISTHPAALAFIQTPKPQPVSFARDAYFSVSAFQFKSAESKISFGKYRIVPEEGTAFLKDGEADALSPMYLFDELTERVKAGPIRFKILVQLAVEDDVVDDATVHWPENRLLLELGAFELTEFVADNPKEQKHIIFDPIPRLDGIEPTADPLFELRAAIYLISGRRRRAAVSES